MGMNEEKLITDLAKTFISEMRAAILIGIAGSQFRSTYREALGLAMARDHVSLDKAREFAMKAARECHDASVKLSEEAADRQWTIVAKAKAAFDALDAMN